MSFVMYRTYRSIPEIEEVTVDKITEKSVWIGGNRQNRSCAAVKYHERFSDAKKHIVNKIKNEILVSLAITENLERRLEDAKKLTGGNNE